jgi:hypothetical protein
MLDPDLYFQTPFIPQPRHKPTRRTPAPTALASKSKLGCGCILYRLVSPATLRASRAFKRRGPKCPRMA